jgi:hypothetical protein
MVHTTLVYMNRKFVGRVMLSTEALPIKTQACTKVELLYVGLNGLVVICRVSYTCAHTERLKRG